MRNILFVISFTAIIFFGCSHTNELAKYDLTGKTMVFTERVVTGARTISIVSEKDFNQKKEGSKDVLETIASIGADILSAENQKRLQDGVDTKSIVNFVSDGFQDALKDYLSVKKVKSFSDNPDFHAETTLEIARLVVSDKGVRVNVQATCKITDLATGATVWENWENRTIPITRNAASNKVETSSTITDILNAVQLAALSTEDLNRAVGLAADDVGYYMVETLRNDILDSRKKK